MATKTISEEQIINNIAEKLWSPTADELKFSFQYFVQTLVPESIDTKEEIKEWVREMFDLAYESGWQVGRTQYKKMIGDNSMFIRSDPKDIMDSAKIADALKDKLID